MIELYTALQPLQPGQAVPDSIYVDDYADGTRPVWLVVDRQELGANGIQLTLEDRDNRGIVDCVRLIVLAFPNKVLRTPPQPHSDERPAVIGCQLCDMAQQERYSHKLAAQLPRNRRPSAQRSVTQMELAI